MKVVNVVGFFVAIKVDPQGNKLLFKIREIEWNMIVPSGDDRPLVTYFQPYNSCNVISENSVLDQLIILS